MDELVDGELIFGWEPGTPIDIPADDDQQDDDNSNNNEDNADLPRLIDNNEDSESDSDDDDDEDYNDTSDDEDDEDYNVHDDNDDSYDVVLDDSKIGNEDGSDDDLKPKDSALEECDNKLKPTIVSALEDEKNDKDEDNNDTIVNHDNDKNEKSDNYDSVSEKQGASKKEARPHRQRSAPQSYEPSFQGKSYFQGLNIRTQDNNFTSTKSTYFHTVQAMFTQMTAEQGFKTSEKEHWQLHSKN